MAPTAPQIQVTPAGRLEETDDLSAILGVLQVMIGTTSTHWPHAPWFGLYEAFAAAAKREKSDHEALKDAINLAWRELGVADFTVESVTTAEADDAGRRQFALVVSDRSGQSLFGTVHAP